MGSALCSHWEQGISIGAHYLSYWENLTYWAHSLFWKQKVFLSECIKNSQILFLPPSRGPWHCNSIRNSCWGETTGPLGSMMGLNIKPRTNLTEKLKLINRDPSFIFKPIKIFYPIRYWTILTYKHLTISHFIVSIPQISTGTIIRMIIIYENHHP